MKKILCLLLACAAGAALAQESRVLVFGDSNTFGYQTDSKGVISRIEPSKTWPEQMGKALGPNVRVIVEGLSGRTTDVDRPLGIGTGRIGPCFALNAFKNRFFYPEDS